jgi:uncharacterized protein (TIGR03435 family)
MKKIFFLTILCSSAFAQIRKGEPVADLHFTTILNAPVKSSTLNALKGKVVIIEFWATWCGSCIAAMPHLSQLQTKFPDKVSVITVTSEGSKRIKKFLTVRPSNLWFALDTAEVISTLFPHRLIPHTVVISPAGLLIANTDPAAVTEDVIERIFNQESVHLPEKNDNQLSFEELIKQNFYASDAVKSRFMIQPEIKGAPGFSTRHFDDRIFKNRRLTAVNCTLSTLYRIAFGDFPYNRTINQMTEADKQGSYCVDLIVPHKEDLLPQLKKELANKFDVRAEIRSEVKDVYVLKIADFEKVKTIPVNTSGQRTYYARHGEMDQQAVTMADLADYLESYGVSNLPVFDETGVSTLFDMKFSFQPEDPASLKEVLKNMGLAIEKARRSVATLYLD